MKDSQIGTALGDTFAIYRLEERLGAGGLAEVWRAVDLDFGPGRCPQALYREFWSRLTRERLRADIELLAAHA